MCGQTHDNKFNTKCLNLLEIRKSQQFLSDQYEEMKKHLHSADEEVKTLRIENQDLKDHVCKLETESGQMQEDINNLQKYGRR